MRAGGKAIHGHRAMCLVTFCSLDARRGFSLLHKPARELRVNSPLFFVWTKVYVCWPLQSFRWIVPSYSTCVGMSQAIRPKSTLTWKVNADKNPTEQSKSETLFGESIRSSRRNRGCWCGPSFF